MVDEFQSKYRNTCEYQQQLRGTLEQFNKEADSALLGNLELQIQSQFLQDDINTTKDRHKKNLAEIQTYLNILQQIIQTIPRMPNLTEGISEDQEKLLAQRRVPYLQSQLEEYKSALWQLQTQKQRLQNELYECDCLCSIGVYVCCLSTYTLRESTVPPPGLGLLPPPLSESAGCCSRSLGKINNSQSAMCSTILPRCQVDLVGCLGLPISVRRSFKNKKKGCNETSVLEQAIKNTQESYDDEIQLYNQQSEGLSKDIEGTERTLEKYANKCRHLAMYRTSLERELDRYKKIIEKEDNRKGCNETSVLEQAIKNTQESYDDEIQLYNEQSEGLSKDIEETERTLEKYANECRHLAMYRTSLERELDRYKRIIEKEDNRLNSAIIGTPITLFTTNYRYSHTPSRGKGPEKKEIPTKDVTDNSADEKTGDTREEGEEYMDEEEVRIEDHGMLYQNIAPEDVPDGTQISKAFDSMCNIVREKVRRYKKPETIVDMNTKGQYVLVTGEASYIDPFFCSSSPSGGQVILKI
ncbi:UNVERIFIED_CONTAM: hypothetical protein FKN15_014257 [Acipenser sinensis]